MPTGTSKAGAKSPPLSILQIKWLLKTRIVMEKEFKQTEGKQEKNALWDKIRRDMHAHFGQKFDNRSSEILRISYENSRKKYVKEKKKLMRQEKRVTSYRHYQIFEDAFGEAVAEEIIANGLMDGEIATDEPSTLPPFEEEPASQNEQEEENETATMEEHTEEESVKTSNEVPRFSTSDRINFPAGSRQAWQVELADCLRTFTSVLSQQTQLMQKKAELEEKRLALETQRESRIASDAEAAREQSRQITIVLQKLLAPSDKQTVIEGRY